MLRTAGESKGLSVGGAVKVSGLVATTWAMGDRSGVSFRAAKVEPAPARAAA